MKTSVILILLSVVLSGCATNTTPISYSEAEQAPAERLLAFQSKPEGPSGKIILTRDVGLLGSGCFYTFYINGTMAARLDAGETSEFFVSPGEKLLRAGRDPQGKALCAWDQKNWTQRETIIRQNEVKYFRMSIDLNGKTDIQRTE